MSIFYCVGFLLLGCPKSNIQKNNKQNEALQSKSVEQNTEESALAWKSTVNPNHPLVGKWWDVNNQQFISYEDVVADIRSSSILLLGEKHDNADHHLLQSKIIQSIPEQDSVAISFEMLNNPSLLTDQTWTSTSQFSTQVQWEQSGWPEFQIYEPIFKIAIQRQYKIVAGSPSRKEMMSVARGTMDEVEMEKLGITSDLPKEFQDDLRQEIINSHCGYASEDMVVMMIAAQRYKDAIMAKSITDQLSTHQKVVLIAGGGHTRNDRGVPLYLDEKLKDNNISILPVEVQEGLTKPEEYTSIADFLYFTPRVDNIDPCEKYKEQLQKMSH